MTRTPLRVVGIGASAGGLDALERFFGHLPADTGMAFVIVQHLSPDFKSLMDELLGRRTRLPIHLVEDGMPVEADHVYLIPPKKEMIISGGRLLLGERDRQQELALPIDIFFRSLARDCGPQAVAIVLSGGGSDGSRGLRDVHEAGGLVIVQDLETAQFDGMPRSAAETGVAHWVLPPEEMPRALVGDVTRSGGPRGNADATSVDVQGVAAVYRMLQDEFGIDFTHYKPSTVTRRIERRLALARSQDIDEYVRRLRVDREELDVLYHDLLIGVTRFFRDREAFAILEQRVLPELWQRGPREAPLRLWVAGCATGEEAYSLAIVVHDLMARLGPRPVKIFATDVHRQSLERAARGVYEEEALAGVSPERKARYFLSLGNAYQVVPELRQMIVFAQHNVIKDAPFTRVDLITCRNLLIYLQPAAQQKVLSLFHFSLNNDGVLLLGPSESIGALARGFEPLDKHWQVYRKHGDLRAHVEPRRPAAAHPEPRGFAGLPLPLGRQSLTQLLGAYDALLEETMPPSLLVSDRGELLHAFAGASRFLRPRDGRQALDVIDMVEPELKMVLIGSLKRVLSEPGTLVYRGVRLGTDGTDDPAASHDVTVRRVRTRGGGAPNILISFEAVERPAPPARDTTEIDLDQVSRQQLGSLEAELSRTKENLQAAIEELETSNEELQASNEELQASNEELQSTNEELQSVNEELYTVNAEYQRKIAELTELTNDMDNLLSSTEVGTIFLDAQLRIRRFTPQIAEVFSLMAHDVGRPIDTFAQRLDYPELVVELRRVIAGGERVERELAAHGKIFFLRILPYRVKGTVDGVVLTLIDVSGLKAAEDALFHERYLLNSLLLSVPDAIYFKDARGRFIRANHAMAARLGLAGAEDAVGRDAHDVPRSEFALALQREDDAILKTGQPQHYRLERRTTPEGTDAWDLVTRLALRDRAGAIVGVIGIFRDVTEQKRADEKIQDAVRRRDQFLAMLSHELRNPLGAIVTATSMMKSDGTGLLKRDRLLEILDRQSQQMAHLLDDLLEASRVTQNKIELRRRIVDLRTVARDAADAIRGQMDDRGITFTLELPDEPVVVDGDPARLQQIQVNLLNNSAKYTPRGGHVVLSMVNDGAEAVVRVRDDGVGIPAQALDSVFDLFVQSSHTLDRAAGGLGLGLTLVRSLVAMHGGTVVGHSEGEGKGSEFVVRLPLAPQGATVAMMPRRRSVALGERAKVIIVEDNTDSRELLCELLEQAGFECRAAAAGSAALDVIEEFRPDVAVLDLGLPGMDGFELARRIRADERVSKTILIALTGYGQAADRAAAREAGFDEHLVKPVQGEQLLSLLVGMRGRRAAS